MVKQRRDFSQTVNAKRQSARPRSRKVQERLQESKWKRVPDLKELESSIRFRRAILFLAAIGVLAVGAYGIFF